VKLFNKLFHDDSGSIAVYSAILAVLGIGGAALAVDYGRLVVVKTQMQDRADSGALAAAVYLDLKPGAMARATDVATNAVRQDSALVADSELRVANVLFYSEFTPNKVAATGDADAKYVEVILQAKQVDIFFTPVLSMVSGTPASGTQELNAKAVAAADPFICNAPPLMMCDPGELDPNFDLGDPANIGRQFRLKEPQAGGGPWTPGNFGLLKLPDGSGGAAALQAALAAVTPADCYTLDVTTAPGGKTNQIKNGMNARFDVTGAPDPAPNVINYPRDADIVADPNLTYGDGNWDRAGYWSDKHGGAGLPGDLATASRFQTYLYELGLEYASDGLQTIYPVPSPLPAGYTTVTPPAVDIPADAGNPSDPNFDGVPSQTAASNGHARRLVVVTVLQCVAQGVQGSATYPSGGNYVAMMVTETVQDPPEAAIYGELLSTLFQATSPDFHANVQLIE
jgi:Flp pilus assembly protein TadG